MTLKHVFIDTLYWYPWISLKHHHISILSQPIPMKIWFSIMCQSEITFWPKCIASSSCCANCQRMSYSFKFLPYFKIFWQTSNPEGKCTIVCSYSHFPLYGCLPSWSAVLVGQLPCSDCYLKCTHLHIAIINPDMWSQLEPERARTG